MVNPAVTFVFLEASIELVPESIRHHPAVVKDSERRKKDPSEILLDDSKHHAAMKSLKGREKRGRPDIVHTCLLSYFDSPFGEKSDAFVHTVEGEIIRFSRGLRLPRNYNRFVGLMERLLIDRVIRSGERILIQVEEYGLEKLFQRINPSDTLLLTEKGNFFEWRRFRSSNPAILIGAFPHGDFSPEVMEVVEKLNPTFVSLGGKSFTSLYVTNRVLCFLEDSWGGLDEGVRFH
jgi:rRNA small subunit pseudouridine methyltransferase Nep1